MKTNEIFFPSLLCCYVGHVLTALLGQHFEEWPSISLQSLLVSSLFSSLLHHGVTWYVFDLNLSFTIFGQ